jgi:hypothetical protein
MRLNGPKAAWFFTDDAGPGWDTPGYRFARHPRSAAFAKRH